MAQKLDRLTMVYATIRITKDEQKKLNQMKSIIKITQHKPRGVILAAAIIGKALPVC